MNNEVRDKLAELIKKFGTNLLEDESKLRAILKDVLNKEEYLKQVNILLLAVREGITRDLNNNSVPAMVLIPQLIKRLENNHGIKESNAQWVVETWAYILGCNYTELSKRYVESSEILYIKDYSDGLFVVLLKNGYGYINVNKEIIIEPQFTYGWKFSEGLAKAIKYNTFGYIDKSGKFVIELQKVLDWYSSDDFLMEDSEYAEFTDFSNGIARLNMGEYMHGNYYRYIDKIGTLLKDNDNSLPPSTGDFEYPIHSIDNLENLTLVKKEGKKGYIDRSGKLVIKPQFDYAYPFKDGLARAKKDHKWGYIDKTGNFVIQWKFNNASFFSEELTAVKKGYKWGYIDKTGKFVIKPQFDYAWSFSDGLAQVKLNGKTRKINKKGEFVD